MRPIRLAVEGFGGFRAPTTVDFDDLELVALVGKTGSGKSTIIDAITFALYGMVARYDDGRKVHPVINALSTEAKVQLVFESGGLEYNATRVIRRTKTGASTKEARLQSESQATVLAEGAKEVSAAAETILGLDFAQFTKVVVLPQGRFSAFLRDSAKDRRVMLAETLGISRYDSIGRTAREIAKGASIQADEKRATLARFETQTSDVDTITNQLDVLSEVSKTLEHARADVEQQLVKRRELAASCNDTEAAIENLGRIEIPGTVSDLETKILAAQAAVDESTHAVAQYQKAYDEASEALKNSPDDRQSKRLLADYEAQQSYTAQLNEVEVALVEARSKSEAADEGLQIFSERVSTLEQELLEAEQAETLVRTEFEQGPNLDKVRLTRAKRQELERHNAELVEGRRELETSTTALHNAERELEQTERAVEQTENVYRHAVAAQRGAELRPDLVVGELCPVCDTTVEKIPPSDKSSDVEGSEQQLVEAQTLLAKQNETVEMCRRALIKQQAAQDAVRARADELSAALKEAPSEAEIEELEQRAAGLDEAVRQASKRRQSLASTLRNLRAEDSFKQAQHQVQRAGVTVQKLEKKEAALTGQLEMVSTRLESAPSVSQLEESITEFQEHTARVADCEQDLGRAVHAQSELTSALAERTAEAESQRKELFAVRDGVSQLKPPSPVNRSVLADWVELASWAEAEKTKQSELLKETQGNIATIDTTVERRVESAISFVDNASLSMPSVAIDDYRGADPATAIVRLGQSIAAAIATLRAQHDLLSAQREQMNEIRSELAEAEATQQVHEMLGEQLKASNFQDWILSEVVAALATRASERLYELSAGQFSLEASELNFEVIDHANGDSRRDARTLSGGETFLASLALALALADGILDMSSNITNPLESLFLDEGFGTLDDDYLDVVASAVEELGAQGRMVVVITHIDELAERIPTRFELTKTNGSSSIERVDL